MKRYLLLLFLLPFYGQTQTPAPTSPTVSAGVPSAPQANASYRGAVGQSPIFYYLCARFPAGSVCSATPAVAQNTTGIPNLGGGNSVTVSWSPGLAGATYYVMRFAQAGFSGACSSCVIASNISATSYVDTSPSTPSGNFPPPGVSPIQSASGQITLDNLHYSSPALLWVLGIPYPIALLPQGYTPGDCPIFSAQPPFLADAPCSGTGGINQLTGDVLAGPGVGSQAATLATVNSHPGSCGDATHSCELTVNGKGLVTAQSSVSINPQVPFGNILTGTNSQAVLQFGVGKGIEPGAGFVSANEIIGVPLCSGYSPSNGQVPTYTTGGSPNPCYAAETPTGGTITGSGTLDMLPIWTGSEALGNSDITEVPSTSLSTPDTWASAQNTSTGDTDAGGNINAAGSVSSGVGSSNPAAFHWYTGDGNDVVWEAGATGVNATELWTFNPTANGQVPESGSCTSDSCTITWAAIITSLTAGTGLSGGGSSGGVTVSCAQGSASAFGCVEVDNSTITASAGVIKTANTTVNGATCTPGSSCNGNWNAGSLTSGHLATWDGTGGELQDGGAVPAGTITGVTAGTGLNGGGSSGGVTLNCDTSTASQIGCAEPDNSTIKASSGVYSAQSVSINGVSCTPGSSCDLGLLWDSNGKATIESSATASAVDDIIVSNAATGTPGMPVIAGHGSDSGVGIQIQGKDVALNGVVGGLEFRGGNQTSSSSYSAAIAGPVEIEGGQNNSSHAASQAGSVEVEGGASINGGEQGLLVLGQNYAQGTTVTQWNMECPTSSAMTAQDCGASPISALGVTDAHNGSTVEVHLPGSISPIVSSNTAVLGDTVCLGAAAPKVTDSGGTTACGHGQGFTVGVVVAVSGEWTFADGASATITTSQPLVQIYKTWGMGNGDLVNDSTTVNGQPCRLGSTCSVSTGATSNQNTRTIGAVLTPSNLTACEYVAFSGTINAFHAVAGDGATADTVLVKVETQSTFSTWISTGVSGASDITNGGEQLTSVLGLVDTTLSGWTTTLAAGTTVCFVGSGFSAGVSVNANINVAAN